MKLFKFSYLFTTLLLVSVLSSLIAQPVSAREARPTLGVLADDIPFQNLEALALRHGVQIVRVISGSPAKIAGLREGDILVEINGEPLTSVSRLRWLMRRAQRGVPMDVTFSRAGAISTVTVRPY
jgi:S1-C subfamily serine protease